jgi:hypothetical protein
MDKARVIRFIDKLISLKSYFINKLAAFVILKILNYRKDDTVRKRSFESESRKQDQ